jgi:BolA protein
LADAAVNAERMRRIEALLRERVGATRVEVIDESHLHAGHAGAQGGAGHFRAHVVSPRFAGLSRIEAQRLVYQALADMIGPDIHALALRCEAT